VDTSNLKNVSISWDENFEGTIGINVPEGAAITITENCGSCDWCIKTRKGKLVCHHNTSMVKRPYADDEKNGRLVVAETRPTWCPL
jgi:hypothetical protein